MFVGMLEGMKEESVGFLFNVTVEACPRHRPPRSHRSPRRPGSPSSRPPRRRAVRASSNGAGQGRRGHQGAARTRSGGPARQGNRRRSAAADLHRAVRGRIGAGAAVGRWAQARRTVAGWWDAPRAARGRAPSEQGDQEPARLGRASARSRSRQPQPICRATIRQPSPCRSTRAAMAWTRRALVYVANTSPAEPPESSTSLQPYPAQRGAPRCAGAVPALTTESMSTGAISGRSCATGLRRSMTSSTRRSAASAKTTAARGGCGSRCAAAASGRSGRAVRRCRRRGDGGGQPAGRRGGRLSRRWWLVVDDRRRHRGGRGRGTG